MPELPDLEMIRERLAGHVAGLQIVSASVLRPIIVRDLTGGDPGRDLAGRSIRSVNCRGKFLLLGLDDGACIAINPMLARRIRHVAPLARERKRDALALLLDDGCELRYNDATDMGKIYLTRDLAAGPAFADLGPDALDPALGFAAFSQRAPSHGRDQDHAHQPD